MPYLRRGASMAKRKGSAAKKPAPDRKPKQKSAPPAGGSKRGCATSFIMRERSEMDKQCGNLPLNDEYVQPDEEKETGGEG